MELGKRDNSYFQTGDMPTAPIMMKIARKAAKFLAFLCVLAPLYELFSHQ
jgi:hypothetical protein